MNIFKRKNVVDIFKQNLSRIQTNEKVKKIEKRSSNKIHEPILEQLSAMNHRSGKHIVSSKGLRLTENETSGGIQNCGKRSKHYQLQHHHHSHSHHRHQRRHCHHHCNYCSRHRSNVLKPSSSDVIKKREPRDLDINKSSSFMLNVVLKDSTIEKRNSDISNLDYTRYARNHVFKPNHCKSECSVHHRKKNNESPKIKSEIIHKENPERRKNKKRHKESYHSKTRSKDTRVISSKHSGNKMDPQYSEISSSLSKTKIIFNRTSLHSSNNPNIPNITQEKLCPNCSISSKTKFRSKLRGFKIKKRSLQDNKLFHQMLPQFVQSLVVCEMNKVLQFNKRKIIVDEEILKSNRIVVTHSNSQINILPAVFPNTASDDIIRNTTTDMSGDNESVNTIVYEKTFDSCNDYTEHEMRLKQNISESSNPYISHHVGKFNMFHENIPSDWSLTQDVDHLVPRNFVNLYHSLYKKYTDLLESTLTGMHNFSVCTPVVNTKTGMDADTQTERYEIDPVLDEDFISTLNLKFSPKIVREIWANTKSNSPSRTESDSSIVTGTVISTNDKSQECPLQYFESDDALQKSVAVDTTDLAHLWPFHKLMNFKANKKTNCGSTHSARIPKSPKIIPVSWLHKNNKNVHHDKHMDSSGVNSETSLSTASIINYSSEIADGKRIKKKMSHKFFDVLHKFKRHM